LSPKTSSANFATPKSGYPTNLARSRSSRPLRLLSRFLARSTFSSVSVTLYRFFPSSGRPAPFRFPPCCFFIT
jgi:hypothetical protein